MLRFIQFIRIACFVFALLILSSGLLAVALHRPPPLTFFERAAIVLPLLALANVATVYLKRKTGSAAKLQGLKK